jgi:putative transposase
MIRADRGSSMKSKTVTHLLADLGVTKIHSRPYVSNDNSFSKFHFKTLKYRTAFPPRFGCIEDARSFCCEFFQWYNEKRYQSELGLLTPVMIHYGKADEVVE